MPVSLAKDFRNQLARTTLEARNVAETAAKAALENLAVHEREFRAHMSGEQRSLRNRLRGRGRALGDVRDRITGNQEIWRLIELVAYENWHRLLFTRFLTENDLLITDATNGSVPITFAECGELATELGERDGLALACRFAGEILPGVFRRNDPALEIPLAINDRVELEHLLNLIPREVFVSDDGLGWTYQYWQAKRKDDINAAGDKIGSGEIAPVTQLFTEDYMVEFLLDNTIGAWWAGKLGPINASSEQEARSIAALPARNGSAAVELRYLRFTQDEESKSWSPAVDTFEAWPTRSKDITFLDPCMGSGHFLVFALPILVRLRIEEESLSITDAIRAVLRDNLFGLELDERCTQIAAFNITLSAWKIGGYQKLPDLNLACSGIAPRATEAEWVKLAGNDDRMQRGMQRLYRLFGDSPTLGSLVNPTLGGDLIEAGYSELHSMLLSALGQESDDADQVELDNIARGISKASVLLASKFTFVCTNVPYLGRGRQDETLRSYSDSAFPDTKSDLATSFLDRSFDFLTLGGTVGVVAPQSWLYMYRYASMRRRILQDKTINCIVRLGPGAFESIGGEVVNVSLVIGTNSHRGSSFPIVGIDVEDADRSALKASGIQSGTPMLKMVSEITEQSDAMITFEETLTGIPLGQFVDTWQGIVTTDDNSFMYQFWEVSLESGNWKLAQFPPQQTDPYTGKSVVIRWERGVGRLHTSSNAHNFPPSGTLERQAIALQRTSDLHATIMDRQVFGDAVAPLFPHDKENIRALWCFAESGQLAKEVKKFDKQVKVAVGSFLKVPFDLDHWAKVADEKYPDTLPLPYSNDPTQWLFSGHPKGSSAPLQVAVARLLGYTWPRQNEFRFPGCEELESDGLDDHADSDGIICLPPIYREQPAGARLRSLLADAMGKDWNIVMEQELIARTGSSKVSLEDWLLDDFFVQHTALFNNRPFIWHVTDGRRDGFHALVNIHTLDHARLQTLTFAYLGDWISQEKVEAESGKAGAAERLGAAQILQTELEKILEGEPPYDIFVRWKSISEQSMGWHPDTNDGVRMNIRPFMMARDIGKKGAGILRSRPNIKWGKDKGKEPYQERDEYPWRWCEDAPGIDPGGGSTFIGNRWNDVHLTLAQKRGNS